MGILNKRSDGSSGERKTGLNPASTGAVVNQPRSRYPNIPDPMHRTSLLDITNAGLDRFPSVMGIISGGGKSYLTPQTVIGDLLGRSARPSRPSTPTYNPRGSHRPADGITSRRLSSVSGTGQEVAIDRGGMIGAPRTERMASVDMFGQGLLGSLLKSFEMVRTNMMRRFGL